MKTMKKTLSLFVLCALLFCNLSFSGTILAFASVVPAESGNEEVEWMSNCSDASGGVFSYYIEEDTPFEIGSTFTMLFYVKDSSQIQSMTHSAVGFTVNGDPTVEAGTVEFSVTHHADVNEPKLEIFYTLNDETEEFAGAYGICYEQGLFLSYASHDAAMSTKYLGYMKSIGAFTQEECQQFCNEYYNQKDAERITEENLVVGEIDNIQFPDLSVMASSTQRTISGTVQWTDSNGNLHPCQYTRIDIYWYATLAPHERLGTVYTDASGTFSFVTDKSIWGTIGAFYPTFYIKIYAGGSGAIVKMANGTDYLKDSGALIDNGNHLLSYTYTFTYSNDLGKAMHIAQAANIAVKYASTMKRSADASLPNVNISYPVAPTAQQTTSYYSNGNIYLLAGDYYSSWDVVMHEYAHHIQRTMGIADNPATKHSLSDNMIDEYRIDAQKAIDDDSYTSIYNIPLNDAKQEGIRLAWAEGWANAYSLVAQGYYKNQLTGIPGVADTLFGSQDVETLSETEQIFLGEGNEKAVAGVLYDLYDRPSSTTSAPVGVSETFDNISLSHQQMWNYVMDSNAVTFHNFTMYILNRGYVDRFVFGQLTEAANISPCEIHITNPASLNSTKALPHFRWWMGGGSTYYPNDNFSLVLYDQNKTQLLQKNNLMPTSNTSEMIYYNLSEAEWNTILATGGTKFYASVVAYQMGDSSGAPQTGPYQTGYCEFAIPQAMEVSMGQSIDGTFSSINEIQWLKVNVAADTRILFYFYGTVNYEADMFTQMIFGTTTEGRIEWNTDSPSSSFRYTLYCAEAQTLYIRLRTYDGSTGTYTVSIE